MLKLLLVLWAGGALCLPLQDDKVPKEEKCGYASCTESAPDLLNVHIVPHTHDDVGWLKTVDQYYFGSRNNIQKAGVQYILDSVIKELWEDPKRRFVYIETAFFWKWWVRQGDVVKGRVKDLVRQGRLQFAGGAWSMNDEAASHYHSTIDQFTFGLRKLNETFGECGRPKVGWQIDPFGHSKEFASLLAEMGYDGLFLGRIDYQDKGVRLRGKTMEMLWRGDDDLGNASDIFTSVLYNTYSPPPGFCFDVLCNDEPIVDDDNSPMFNVDQKVGKFLEYVTEQGTRYLSNNVLVTMGGDFTYQDAGMWYTNLDKLIEYTNLKAAKDGLNVKLFYSTPDCYLKAVKDAYPSLPTKQDDFFPYASDPTAYWTGYFTSRPTTKYFERRGNAYLQMVKQLQVLTNLPEHNMFVIDELKSAMGVMQHHDAITGTEKQHVANDYVRILNSAIDDATIVAKQAFNKITQGDALKPPKLTYERCALNESSCYISETKRSFVVTVYNPLAWKVTAPIRVPVVEGSYAVYAPNGEEITSQLIDIPSSVIEIPTRNSTATHEVVFLAYLHPLGLKSYYIKNKEPKIKRNTKSQKEYYENLDEYWTDIKQKPYLDIRNLEDDTKTQDKVEIEDVKTKKSTVINQRVPDYVKIDATTDNCGMQNPVGTDSVNVDVLKDRDDVISDDILQLQKIIRDVKEGVKNEHAKRLNYPKLNDEEMRMLSDDPVVVEAFGEAFIENEFMKLRFDNSTGQLNQVVINNKTVSLSVGLYSYIGHDGDNSNTTLRASGAYIFRPVGPQPDKLVPRGVEYRKGPVSSEVRVRLAGNAFSILRIYQGLRYIEHEFLVGPIPVGDGKGKEYVARYETDIRSGEDFYTDCNGRQLLKRRRDRRAQWNLTLAEPVPGNYYPVTEVISIEDDATRLSVAVDRSEGGTSMSEGQIEVMLHRRLLFDDAFGVGEALDETVDGLGLTVRGDHRVLINSKDERRETMELHYNPVIYVSNAEDLKYEDWLTMNNMFQGVGNVPNGVHILTLEPWKDGSILLRLENYLERKENGDDTIEVDLTKLFNGLAIKSFRETTLAANQWLKDNAKWTWSTFEGFESHVVVNAGNDDGLKVRLAPKHIRTLVVEYEYAGGVNKL